MIRMIPIEKAKEQVEDQLMLIEGVEGVGIGLEGKTPVIQVYVSRMDRTIREKVPHEVEGHPVKIEIGGKFRAL